MAPAGHRHPVEGYSPGFSRRVLDVFHRRTRGRHEGALPAIAKHNIKLERDRWRHGHGCPRPTIFPASFQRHASTVEALTNISTLDDTKQLRSLMSGIGCYRKFLRNPARPVRSDQGYGRGGTPIFNGVFEPPARVSLYPTDVMV